MEEGGFFPLPQSPHASFCFKAAVTSRSVMNDSSGFMVFVIDSYIELQTFLFQMTHRRIKKGIKQPSTVPCQEKKKEGSDGTYLGNRIPSDFMIMPPSKL
jgi:hypothetical protein